MIFLHFVRALTLMKTKLKSAQKGHSPFIAIAHHLFVPHRCLHFVPCRRVNVSSSTGGARARGCGIRARGCELLAVLMHGNE